MLRKLIDEVGDYEISDEQARRVSGLLFGSAPKPAPAALWREQVKSMAMISLKKDGIADDEAEIMAVNLVENISKWHASGGKGPF